MDMQTRAHEAGSSGSMIYRNLRDELPRIREVGEHIYFNTDSLFLLGWCAFFACSRKERDIALSWRHYLVLWG